MLHFTFQCISDLQVFASATNATFDNMRAHMQVQGEAQQSLEARLENIDKNIVIVES